MATIAKSTETGIQQAANGWIVVRVTLSLDDSGVEWRESRRRLVAGPFSGPGAKRAAIEAAGTNAVFPQTQIVREVDADVMALTAAVTP